MIKFHPISSKQFTNWILSCLITTISKNRQPLSGSPQYTQFFRFKADAWNENCPSERDSFPRADESREEHFQFFTLSFSLLMLIGCCIVSRVQFSLSHRIIQSRLFLFLNKLNFSSVWHGVFTVGQGIAIGVNRRAVKFTGKCRK